MELSRHEIREAYNLISPYVRRTPVIDVEPGTLGGTAVLLKLELMQVGGSFKARGAFTNLLTRPVPATGVAAASGGNPPGSGRHSTRRRRRGDEACSTWTG